MSAKSHPHRLKNKFQEIENGLSGNKTLLMPTSSTNKVSIVDKKSEIPIFYRYSGYILRVFSLLIKLVANWTIVLWQKILSPLGYEFFKTATFTHEKIIEAKEKSEIVINSKLIEVETSFQRKREQDKLQENIMSASVLEYKNEISYIFQLENIKIDFVFDQIHFSNANTSLEFDLTLYELIALKLKDTKMIFNVTSLLIHCFVDDKKVVSTVSFEIKQQCQKWSIMFSRYISSEIQKRIINYQGVVENSLTEDVLKKISTFKIVFVHQRLDCYMKEAQSERVEVSRVVRPVHSEVQI